MTNGRILRWGIGSTFLVLSGLPAATHAAATLKTLTIFNSTYQTSGDQPAAGVVVDSSGNLYGTTTSGGTGDDGTVYELPAGSSTLQTLVTFSGSNGSTPEGNLLFDASGDLYGTTSSGNSGGTVFKIAAGSHAFSTIATFGSASAYGLTSGLVADTSGNLYGATSSGSNGGTVFKIAGTESASTVAALGSLAPGGGQVTVTLGSGGNLYGTSSANSEYGDVFEIAAGSNTASAVVNFNRTDGANPYGGLAVDAHGNLYGTTLNGGTYGDGTIFEITAGTNTFKSIASFDGLTPDGSTPYGGVIADADGNLFGTTAEGGEGYGTVFEVPAGTNTITTIAEFNNNTSGAYPEAGLTADANGSLFGTTYGGGSNIGSVFEVTGSAFVVPEPSGMLLIGVCGAVLLRRRARPTASSQDVVR